MADKPQDIGTDSLKKAKRDEDDLNREIAGVNTSRQSRFFSGEATGMYGGDTKEKKAERAYRSLLEMLLAEDPHYAVLYKRVAEKLERAQRAVDKALVDINQRIDESGQALQRMRENAAELEDGTKVFRSHEDGHIYTEDGRQLSEDEARNVSVPDDAPCWEDYRAQKQAQDDALRQREEVERYQREVLDPAQKRIEDEDNPLSMDELEDLDQHIENKIPARLHENHDPETSASSYDNTSFSVAHDEVEVTDISSMPEMAKSFDQARTDIPDQEPAPGQGMTNTLG